MFAVGLGYGVDEAYAVAVARPLSLSYFDHPPLHFWLAGFMTWLTGVSTPWVVRLPFLLAFAITQGAIGALTRLAFGERAARIAVLVLSVSGVLGVTSASWVLPDGPLLAAASLAAVVLAPLFMTTPASNAGARAWRWIAGGALLGIALLAKYHGVLYLLGVGVLTLARRETRNDLRTPWPWMALLLVLAGLIPTLWWNAQHDWVSFRFQGARAASAVWSPAPLLELLVGQLAWLLPWVAIPMAVAVVHAVRRAREDAALMYCLAWCLPALAVFTAVSARGARTLPHWTTPGCLFAAPLVGWWWTSTTRLTRSRARWVHVAPWTTATLVLLVIVQARSHLIDRFLSPAQRAIEPTRDALSWAPALPGDSSLLLVRSWIQGGQLGASTGTPRAIVCLCTDPHHFAFRANTPRLWTHGVLVERAQPWKPGWYPASLTLAGDSLRIVARDSLRLDDAVLLLRYDVTRRGSSAFVKQNLRPMESSDREIER